MIKQHNERRVQHVPLQHFTHEGDNIWHHRDDAYVVYETRNKVNGVLETSKQREVNNSQGCLDGRIAEAVDKYGVELASLSFIVRLKHVSYRQTNIEMKMPLIVETKNVDNFAAEAPANRYTTAYPANYVFSCPELGTAFAHFTVIRYRNAGRGRNQLGNDAQENGKYMGYAGDCQYCIH